VKIIRALIVQGFPQIRGLLRDMIAAESDLVLIGECADGRSAVTAIRKHRPELLFLGVRLRGMNGFDVLDSLDGGAPPAVIFVSPFERYAARAFSVHAVDYLLKPFTPQRFKQAIQRARLRLKHRDAADAAKTSAPLRLPRPISVKTEGRILLLRPEEIDAVVAHRNYSALHAGHAVHLTRSSLSDLQTKLPAGKFLRISRSTLINTRRFEEIIRTSHGDGLLRLKNGQEFRVSRRYRAQWSALVEPKSPSS
jgi:two-component system LytT family response regulator